MHDDIDYCAIGKRIKIARINADYTQERLANKLSMTVTHISNIERGNAHLSLSTFIRIANILNVNADQLLCDNIVLTKHAFTNEITQIAEHCDEIEIRILTEVMAATLDALRNGHRVQELADYYKTDS